jgi:hypothetical protein
VVAASLPQAAAVRVAAGLADPAVLAALAPSPQWCASLLSRVAPAVPELDAKTLLPFLDFLLAIDAHIQASSDASGSPDDTIATAVGDKRAAPAEYSEARQRALDQLPSQLSVKLAVLDAPSVALAVCLSGRLGLQLPIDLLRRMVALLAAKVPLLPPPCVLELCQGLQDQVWHPWLMKMLPWLMNVAFYVAFLLRYMVKPAFWCIHRLVPRCLVCVEPVSRLVLFNDDCASCAARSCRTLLFSCVPSALEKARLEARVWSVMQGNGCLSAATLQVMLRHTAVTEVAVGSEEKGGAALEEAAVVFEVVRPLHDQLLLTVHHEAVSVGVPGFIYSAVCIG